MGEVNLQADPGANDARLKELANSGLALAMQLLRNRHDAADAVQDSLHTVLRKRRMFDPNRGEFRVWFLKIVRNRCLDMLRRSSRQHADSGNLSQISDAAQSPPDTIAEQTEMLDVLRTTLEAMPQQQREIIVLRDYHNLTYAELAEVLSIPVGTVMSKLHRARLELRRRMERYL